ncbi:MAG: hypothetical protein ACLQVI_07825 [Polyangiaceae bacterium]
MHSELYPPQGKNRTAQRSISHDRYVCFARASALFRVRSFVLFEDVSRAASVAVRPRGNSP